MSISLVPRIIFGHHNSTLDWTGWKLPISRKDREGLEWLCRYIARPPLAQERLEEVSDGTYKLTLKTPWSDGTSSILLSRMEIMERLVALIPPPRANQVLYHGIFVPERHFLRALTDRSIVGRYCRCTSRRRSRSLRLSDWRRRKRVRRADGCCGLSWWSGCFQKMFGTVWIVEEEWNYGQLWFVLPLRLRFWMGWWDRCVGEIRRIWDWSREVIESKWVNFEWDCFFCEGSMNRIGLDFDYERGRK